MGGGWPLCLLSLCRVFHAGANEWGLFGRHDANASQPGISSHLQYKQASTHGRTLVGCQWHDWPPGEHREREIDGYFPSIPCFHSLMAPG